MDSAAVLEIAAYLDERGVRFWIDGGWGVDALLREQTRVHADLDIAVELADSEAYEQAVGDAGSEFLYYDPANDQDGRHLNWVVKDDLGREIDVHLVDTSVALTGPNGGKVYGGIPYPVGCFEATGLIGGSEVRCCTAEFHMTSHTGYEITDSDIHDVAALHHRFGLQFPAEYADLIVPNVPPRT